MPGMDDRVIPASADAAPSASEAPGSSGFAAAQSEPVRPRRRHWYQFTLRAVLALILLAALALTAWRVYVAPYEAQLRTMQLIQRLGGSCQADAAPRWMSRLGGAKYQIVTSVNLADCDAPGEFIEAVAQLPNLQCLVVGGVSFSDDELVKLRQLRRLRVLVLDSTVVTDDALEGLREALPELQVYRSQRRLMRATRFKDFWVGRPRTDAILAPWQITVEEAIEAGAERALLPQLAHCHGLEKLTLGSRDFEDGDMAHLAGLRTSGSSTSSVDSTTPMRSTWPGFRTWSDYPFRARRLAMRPSHQWGVS